ncbi:hypothetical protein [Psychrobacillus sp. L4]|uniref:hypothetical protein n=1 Tax=Psychrobacillus sp. L4 TaxID=3236892 RepID=UPI0036F2645C
MNEDKDSCDNTLFTCVFIIANVSRILEPFLPFSSATVKEMLNLDRFSWKVIRKKSYTLSFVSPLFERLDTKLIEEELTFLESKMNNN